MILVLLLSCSVPAHRCWEQQIRTQPLPVPLPEDIDCSPHCDRWEARAESLMRAGRFLASQTEELRFDAAIGVPEVLRIVTSPSWRSALDSALKTAQRDADHPNRRWFDPDFRVDAEVTTRFSPPEPGGRIPYNRVTSEALHCRENGWRQQTEQYVCTLLAQGGMRDGSYGTTHALWALQIARDAGCTEAKCIGDLLDELSALLLLPWPEAPDLSAIDLRAEAAVMLLRDGRSADETIERLMAAQGADGGWGGATERAPLRYHATMLAAWAIALDVRHRAGRSEP